MSQQDERSKGAPASAGLEYDETYFATQLGEPYHRGNPVWRENFGSIADYIVTAFGPSTVLDVGCAIGFLVEALRERGVDAYGIDISEYAISQVPEELKPYCRVGSATDEIEGTHDLITCIEVLEHLSAEEAELAIDNVTRHTARVLFSSTPDDESEPTHSNVRQPDAWVRAFAERGFFPRPAAETVRVSPQAMILERSEQDPVDVAASFEQARYALARRLADAERGLEEARSELDRSTDTIRGLEETVRGLGETILALEGTILALEKAFGRSQSRAEQLDEVLASSWWRLGRPARAVITRIRLRGRPSRPSPDTGARRRVIRRLVKPLVPLRLRRTLRERYPASTDGLVQSQGESKSRGVSVDDLLATRFPLLRPLPVIPVPAGGRRLTLVTDSLSAGSLFGGVGTAIIFAALLARRLDSSLRIVTRDSPPEPESVATVLQAQGVLWDENIEFVHSSLAPTASGIPVHSGDLFLTTSWWSTWAALRSVDPTKIVYLIQEDERLFYPSGDEQLMCSEVIADGRIRFVVNTSILHEYLVSEGFDNIAAHGVAFEPAFPESIYFREPRPAGARKIFFFYARPHNVRNLFLRGLEAVHESIINDILDADGWEFSFVGKDIPRVTLPHGIVPQRAENLPWPEYARLIRRVDVGLSLISSPHPSYPPLDLAACGAVAVTNRFGPKHDLARYSANVICTDLSTEAVVGGIQRAVELAGDEQRRDLNRVEDGLSRSWSRSFEHVLDELARTL